MAQPSGRGEGRSPVGALPPYLPRGFFTLTYKKNTQEKKEEKNREQETTQPRERKQFSQLER